MASETEYIPVDENYADDDSIELNDDSSARSLASTVTRFRYENGRRYHAYRDGQYWGPNDEKSIKHQNIANHMFLLTLNDKLFLAPLQDPKKVMDVGTGAGMWAIDFADQFPGAEVIGTDLSPIQPSFGIPNLSFEIDDCCSAWTYPPNSFDFIHVRGLYGSVQDWPGFYQECLQCLKPGGYIEQLEFSILADCDDGTSSNNEALRLWGEYGFTCAEKTGRTFKVANHMKGWIKDAGFEDVVERRYKWPIGPWSSDPKLKEIGKWNLVHWEEGIEGWCLALMTRTLGFPYDEVQKYISEMLAAVHNRNYHLYQDVRVVYARKPFEAAHGNG